MEQIRTNIRHVVLALKLSEEKRSRFKEKLASIYRTMQNQPNFNVSTKGRFASYTKHCLEHLKEMNEQHKSFRANLRTILIKFSEQKADTDKKNGIPVFTEKNQSAKNSSLILNIQRTHYIHLISSECNSNIERQTIRTHNFSNLTSTMATNNTGFMEQKSVNSQNNLTMFRKFTGKRISIRVGIG